MDTISMVPKGAEWQDLVQYDETKDICAICGELLIKKLPVASMEMTDESVPGVRTIHFVHSICLAEQMDSNGSIDTAKWHHSF
jgi:hypothetical protein